MKTRVSLKCFVNYCRPTLVNADFNGTLFLSIYCMNVKVLNLVLGINKKIFLTQYECVRVNED